MFRGKILLAALRFEFLGTEYRLSFHHSSVTAIVSNAAGIPIVAFNAAAWNMSSMQELVAMAVEELENKNSRSA